MEGITERIRNAACTADILNAREDYLRLYSEYHTMSALAYMRYSVNTADEFYSAENDYYDEAGPAVHSLIADYAAALLDSPFRAELERELSPLLFRSMELQRKAISPVIVDDMVEENRLISEYSKLMAGMEFDFIPGGDPRPCGKDGIFAAAREMYHAMSQETGEFIDMMLENEAFDVDSRKNKWGGGYCTEFVKYRQPFILANFDGTAGDVDVVTHEAGHALNAWLIADNRFALELDCGGMETAETHSMSMEFFAWPYMEKFFGGGAAAYRYMHALDAFSFIPYGTAVDEFQHIIYAHSDMTPAERNAAWLGLEKKYRPHISVEGIPYLEKGTRWQYQMHIYESPFYYIDYCLAQTAAFNFLLASLDDYEGAFGKYMRFSRQGGEKLWTELLAEAGFVSPFTPGALGELASRIGTLLEKIKI